ncbi:MAG: YdcF family protein [Christensenellales bacterium]
MISFVITAESKEDIRAVDAIFVPGCKVMPSGRPSFSLQKRIDRAAQLYKEGYAGYIVVSGGKGPNEPEAEGDVMARELIAQGIPEESILIENESSSTRENVRNSLSIMRRHDIESVMVVTSEFHLMRAKWTLRQEGVSDIASAAAQSYPKHLWAMRIREVFSLIKCAAGK